MLHSFQYEYAHGVEIIPQRFSRGLFGLQQHVMIRSAWLWGSSNEDMKTTLIANIWLVSKVERAEYKRISVASLVYRMRAARAPNDQQ